MCRSGPSPEVRCHGARRRVHRHEMRHPIVAVERGDLRATAIGETFRDSLDKIEWCGGIDTVIALWQRHAAHHRDAIMRRWMPVPRRSCAFARDIFWKRCSGSTIRGARPGCRMRSAAALASSMRRRPTRAASRQDGCFRSMLRMGRCPRRPYVIPGRRKRSRAIAAKMDQIDKSLRLGALTGFLTQRLSGRGAKRPRDVDRGSSWR